MRDISGTAAVPDDQVSLALTRVHGRLRRRRNRLRGVGAAAMTCLALLGVGVATQGQEQEAEVPTGIDAMAPGGPTAGGSMPDDSGICGHLLPPSEVFGLELTIQGPVEWPAPGGHLGVPSPVVVEARNTGSSSLTLQSAVSVVGLGDDALVETEPAAAVAMPAAATLESSDAVELPAALPYRTCTGEVLADGTYTIAPVVALRDDRQQLVLVRGTSLSARHR